jgi:hypothetical protein
MTKTKMMMTIGKEELELDVTFHDDGAAYICWSGNEITFADDLESALENAYFELKSMMHLADELVTELERK